jgi:hypothetical protein
MKYTKVMHKKQQANQMKKIFDWRFAFPGPQFTR